MYRILISGYYGFNNIGDESILRTMVDSLKNRIPDVEITILSQNPADTSEKYHVKAVPRMSLREIIRAIRKSDLLISGGGSLLQDVTSNSSILYYLFIIRLAQLFRKKVILYSQGIGPIKRPMNRRLTAHCLRKVDEIAVRDEASARLLEEIHVPAELISVTADPVLGIRKAGLERGKEILKSIGCDPEDGKLLIGWAIKTNDLSSPFLKEIEKAIRWTNEKYHARSVLIPFHYAQDVEAVQLLAKKLEGRAFCLTRKYLSDEMLSIIGNTDCIVGVRLHSLIFAAVMDVPFLGISYDPKIDAFAQSLGRHCVSTQERFRLRAFQRDFSELMERRERVRAENAVRTAELKSRLEENAEMIFRVLEGEVKHGKLIAPKENAQKDSSKSPTDTAGRKAAEKNRQKTGRKKKGILAAIGSVMVITVLAKVLGIVREAIQANAYGTADAFYASYNKTIYLYTTIGYAICVAAVPLITKALERSRQEGERVANNLTTFSLLLSLVAMGIWMLFTKPSIASQLWGAQSTEVIPFMRIMILTLPVIVVTYLMVAVYQSMDHFALQGSISLPYSVFLIAYLLIAANRLPLIMYAVAVAAAWLLQFLMTVPYAVKERYLYRPVFEFRQPYLRTFLKTAVVTIVTTSAYLFCYLTDAGYAADLGEGWTSAFYYADKIFTPLVTTFIYSISAVLFPRFNREFTKSNRTEYMKYIWSITANTMIVVFPVCAILMVLGGPIIRVLFESGNFTAESTLLTTGIFAMYALGMAGFSVIDLLNKAFFSMGKSLAPLLISLGVIALNLVLDALFHFHGNVLALSTAASMSVGAAVTIAVMFRGSGIIRLQSVLKSLAAAVVTGGAAYVLKQWLIYGDEGKILLVGKGIAVGGVGAVIFVLLCMLLRVDEITRFFKGGKSGEQ